MICLAIGVYTETGKHEYKQINITNRTVKWDIKHN